MNVKTQIRDAIVTALAAEGLVGVTVAHLAEVAAGSTVTRVNVRLGADELTQRELGTDPNMLRTLAFDVELLRASAESYATAEAAVHAMEVLAVRAVTQGAGVLALVDRVVWAGSSGVEGSSRAETTVAELRASFSAEYSVRQSDLETFS